VKKLNNLLTVAQYTLDLLCCPVILAERERVFSGVKLLISPNRNRLTDYIIRVAECLRSNGCGAFSKNREKKRHNRGCRDDEGGSQGGSELVTK
jgi:hypothetical protein